MPQLRSEFSLDLSEQERGGSEARIRPLCSRMGRGDFGGLVLSIFEQALLLGSLTVFTAFILWHSSRAPSRRELALSVISCSLARWSSSARQREVGGRVA
jgi:hypothetical protein